MAWNRPYVVPSEQVPIWQVWIGHNAPSLKAFRESERGAWVFRGTRVPVSAIFENLKCSSVDEVLENFHVTREQVQAVLDFAAKSAVPPAEPSRAA
jgi:uncharacterized protein (DUF433 family)